MEDKENKIPGAAELTDEEAKNIVGGIGDEFNKMVYFEIGKPVEYIYSVGEEVEVAWFGGIGTVRCKITAVRDEEVYETQTVSSQHTHYIKRHCDQYYCVQLYPSHAFFSDGWKNRSDIEK